MSLWITRERPRVDRVAVPWLIRRFVDQKAQFIFTPARQVLETARRTGATSFDVDGAEVARDGDLCAFEVMLKRYKLEDRVLQRLATIVRGANTKNFDAAPESAGLFAVSMGLSHLYPNDHDQLQRAFGVYDALYAWAAREENERHVKDQSMILSQPPKPKSQPEENV